MKHRLSIGDGTVGASESTVRPIDELSGEEGTLRTHANKPLPPTPTDQSPADERQDSTLIAKRVRLGCF